MLGIIFVTSYFLSIGYNTIKLQKIRKETIKQCKEKLEGAGCIVNSEKVKSILDTSKKVDDLGYSMLSYMPFGSYLMTYKLISGKIRREYDAVSKDVLNQEMMLTLKRQQIIFIPSYIKTLTKEERVQFEKTHQIYKPGDPILISSMDRLIDGFPTSEQLSMEEVNEKLDRKVKEKSLRKY